MIITLKLYDDEDKHLRIGLNQHINFEFREGYWICQEIDENRWTGKGDSTYEALIDYLAYRIGAKTK